MSERRTVPKFIGKDGRTVCVGDFVIYGHNLGRCAGMRFGIVLKIEVVTDYRGDDEWRIQVRGIDDDWRRDIGDAKPCRKGTLMYPERIMGVNMLIPDDFKELLMKPDEEAKN